MINRIRHGDLAFRRIDKLPEGLKKADTKVFMQGSHGNPHYFEGEGDLYFRKDGQFIIGYFVSYDGSTLCHVEHGCKKTDTVKTAPCPVGIWELSGQHEDTNTGMKPVID